MLARGRRHPVFTVALAILLASTPATRLAAQIKVAVVHGTAWSPGNAARDGAGELEVLLRVAQLERASTASGLVAVGDRNGMLRSGGERALRRIVCSGVVVAKLAPGGAVDNATADLFLDARSLGTEEVAALLEQCLARHGAPPSAANPDHVTERERALIRAHLRPFQTALVRAASSRPAAR